MQLPAPEDAEQATTSTPTTTGKSLQPLATDDKTALRRLGHHTALGQYDVESPFPLDEQQKESLREGAIRPARVPAAEAVRTASQAVIGGSTRGRGWGAKAALGPVAEGLAQYLEWHAGARDQPSFGRIAFESAVPLAFSRENIEQTTPRPEGESTEREKGELYKQARRAFEDLVKQEKEKRGISTETTWEDVLGEHHPRHGPEDDPLTEVYAPKPENYPRDPKPFPREDELRQRHPPKGYQRGEDPSLPPIGSYRDPGRNKNWPYDKPPYGTAEDDLDWHPPEQRRETHEEPIEAEWEALPDDEWDMPAEQDVSPDEGPIAKEPLDPNYIPLPHTPSESEWRTTKRMAQFRKGGPVQTGARIGALAVARGAGGAGTQPGMSPQFLRRVDAELEARMKGDHAYSIFAPFTNDQLQEMRDVQIHGADE